jgi:hypothetical protein
MQAGPGGGLVTDRSREAPGRASVISTVLLGSHKEEESSFLKKRSKRLLRSKRRLVWVA